MSDPTPSTPDPWSSFPAKRLLSALVVLALLAGLAVALLPTGGGNSDTAGQEVQPELVFESRTLDGTANNADDELQGSADSAYTRVSDANYADDLAAMTDGPEPRYVSNRIFNDVAQNTFSENDVTQWAWTWGQFIDHTIGLAEGGEEEAPIAFDASDPLEEFANDLGSISFTRSAAASGTGEEAPREQVNTVSSYIDAWSVYGGDDDRLEWLREGPVDGDLSNNGARLLLTDDGMLPTAAERGDASSAPEMQLPGRLMGTPDEAVIAGDERANENIALTAVHTLFAREHNRIVDVLPDDLSENEKFDIARRLVGAVEQYITYTEFLPALGVDVGDYDGYDSDVDASITNEFAAVGYRAHSMIHGEFELEGDGLDEETVAALEQQGVEIADGEVAVPLNVAFGNPGLVEDLGLGEVLVGLGGEPQYNNDEQIDNQLRSVLFQVPGPDVEDPMSCLDGSALSGCFAGVNDLGALDIQRARDHGMPTYNELREAYGLEPATSFTDVTGEATQELPEGMSIDDPAILEVVALADGDGNALDPEGSGAEVGAVRADQASTVAARLAAVYGDVESLDAFVGMVAEPHIEGTEFGALQLAMWEEQFAALRDGDRFFYGNDPVLEEIRERYDIDYRRSLSDLVVANTGLLADEVPDDLFTADEEADTPADDESAAGAEVPDGDGGDESGNDDGTANRGDGRGGDGGRDRDGPDGVRPERRSGGADDGSDARPPGPSRRQRP